MLVILSVITVGCLLVCVRAAFGYEHVLLGEVDVEVYFVALDGVSARGVGNITNMVDGVFDASRVNVSSTSIDFPIYGDVRINTTVTVVHDWNTYRSIVEAGSGIIVVNGHGETVPVPSGYTRDAWVDKIAEAMLGRNVTWVHTGGYPFNYSYLQESGEQGWGEEGFQRLMSHVGKGTATCNHPRPTEIADMTLDAGFSVFIYGWYDLANTVRVQKGNPLKSSDFKNCTILPIWGSEDDYMTGAVITFAETSSASGFYVHIGTNQTYRGNNIPTDRDYYRGYAGSAAALWACAWHSASRDAISAANASIVKAEVEGRTKGLEDAKKLLQNAEELLEATHRNDYDEISRLLDMYYSLDTHNGFGTVALRAIEAGNLAEKAVQPTFLEANLLLITTILIVAGVATTAVIVTRHTRNSRKEIVKPSEKNKSSCSN